MAFPFDEKFATALPYQEYLQQHGSAKDRQKWSSVAESLSLSADQRQLLHGFRRKMQVLCMAGAWCGDCVQQCPIFGRFQQESSMIDLRLIDRDIDHELTDELKICGAARVPQVVFLSEEGALVGRYGDRTLATYRKMARELSGAACSTGLVIDTDSTLDPVVQQWLDEFERVQLILRTSPHLRTIHGD